MNFGSLGANEDLNSSMNSEPDVVTDTEYEMDYEEILVLNIGLLQMFVHLLQPLYLESKLVCSLKIRLKQRFLYQI